MKRKPHHTQDQDQSQKFQATAIDQETIHLSHHLKATKTNKGSALVAKAAFQNNQCVLAEHPLCLGHRLPSIHNLDELMQQIVTKASRGDAHCALMIKGAWAMSHVHKHWEQQQTTCEDLPTWAKSLNFQPEEYNLLAARLQSNVVRHDDVNNSGLVLNPLIRLANHACDPNTDLAWAPDVQTNCACGAGQFMLVARRDIEVGEEITYSYIGPAELYPVTADRRALLLRRWGFECDCSLCRRSIVS